MSTSRPTTTAPSSSSSSSTAVQELRKEMRRLADPKKAEALSRFFKTGKGQYGEGDVFLGIVVPRSRLLAKKHAGRLALADIKELLHSAVHEERLVALLVLVDRYRSDPENVARFYLENLGRVNNWDLVDLSAPKILGPHLERVGKGKSSDLLCRLVRSESVWERRAAMVSTLHFIRKGDFADALKIAGMLLSDSHDLVHKAAGWMLREVYKRDPAAAEAFLEENCARMPRTMLRYAVERMPEGRRRRYMVAAAAKRKNDNAA
ncbi:DNA alkylation repair protein [Nitrososphaera sp.]|uniref:DNA alkylation repair protein n=1 Tax=Nitrososphaera sp. TaxID=1971748 RepID=UPI00307D48CF